MGIKIYQDRSKIEGLQRLAAENEQSGGTFHIENLSQFHIRRLHSAIPDTMRFRLHVPAEVETYLHAGVFYGGAEQKSFMATQAVSLRPGESIVSLYSDVDFVDKEVRTLVANIDNTSSGSDFTLRLDHFKVYEELNTEFSSWFKANQGSLHGPLEIFNFDNDTSVKALLHLPDGVEARYTTVQDKPVGVAIWLAPKPMKGPIDSRFNKLETVANE